MISTQQFPRVLFLLILQYCRGQWNDNKCLKQVSECANIPSDNNQCLGGVLPYSDTALVFSENITTVDQSIQELDQWTWLRSIPKCWEVVQPLLCSVYFPKCTTERNGSFLVEYPGLEVCELTREPCKLVDQLHEWPTYLQCNQPHFVRGCGRPLQHWNINSSATCLPPLIRTDSSAGSWVRSIPGCAIPCRDPYFTSHEHTQTQQLVGALGTICLACTLFTVLTFLVDWRSSNHYPPLIVFCINVCYCVGSLGWLAQFIPGFRELIVCRRDGTTRIGAPQNDSEQTLCIIVFLLVYFTIIANLTWFVILAYAWSVAFRFPGTSKEVLHAKKGKFHMACWTLPLVLSIVIIAQKRIDGDWLSGICFVGLSDTDYRVGFVLVPSGVSLVVAATLIARDLARLVKIRCSSDFLNERDSSKLIYTIVRIGLFAGLAFLLILTTFVVHIYTLSNKDGWRDSFEDYIDCRLLAESERIILKGGPISRECAQKHRPNLVAAQIHIAAYFLGGVLMSSWSWNRNTILAWRNALNRFRRKFIKKTPEEKAAKKTRKALAHLAKRNQLEVARLSLSLASHRQEDPMGLQYDINSVSSQELTSVWSAALPHMTSRRDNSVFPAMRVRRHSDSDLESMKSSLSSLNQRVAEMTAEILRHNAHTRQSQESQSQQESLDSDRSRRRRKRRQRKKRGETITTTLPIATTTNTQGNTGTAPQIEEKRKGSLTSLATNPTLTNVSNSLPQSSNTSRVPSSDEDRATPEHSRPRHSRILPSDAPKSPKKPIKSIDHVVIPIEGENGVEKDVFEEGESGLPVLAPEEASRSNDSGIAESRYTANENQAAQNEANRNHVVLSDNQGDMKRKSRGDSTNRKQAMESARKVSEASLIQHIRKRSLNADEIQGLRVKGKLRQTDSGSIGELLRADSLTRVLSEGQECYAAKHKAPPLDEDLTASECDYSIHSSDEAAMTPKLNRPKHLLDKEDLEDYIRSSDEECFTPKLQRPPSCRTQTLLSTSDSLHSSDSQVAIPEPKRPVWARLQTLLSTSDSLHSSDSQVATPEPKRPEWARLQVTTITRQTTTTIRTGSFSTSLLDQVELEDFDGTSDTDLAVYNESTDSDGGEGVGGVKEGVKEGEEPFRHELHHPTASQGLLNHSISVNSLQTNSERSISRTSGFTGNGNDFANMATKDEPCLMQIGLNNTEIDTNIKGSNLNDDTTHNIKTQELVKQQNHYTSSESNKRAQKTLIVKKKPAKAVYKIGIKSSRRGTDKIAPTSGSRIASDSSTDRRTTPKRTQYHSKRTGRNTSEEQRRDDSLGSDSIQKDKRAFKRVKQISQRGGGGARKASPNYAPKSKTAHARKKSRKSLEGDLPVELNEILRTYKLHRKKHDAKKVTKSQMKSVSQLSMTSPFTCDSEGRSRSPQVSPFQKVKDWIFTPPSNDEMEPAQGQYCSDLEKGADLELKVMKGEGHDVENQLEQEGEINPGFQETET